MMPSDTNQTPPAALATRNSASAGLLKVACGADNRIQQLLSGANRYYPCQPGFVINARRGYNTVTKL